MGGRGLVASAVSLGAAIALAAPSAWAGIPQTVFLGNAGGLDYFKSTADSVQVQGGTFADCNENTVVTGGGATISGSGADAALNTSAATDSWSTWLAEGTSLGS